MAQSLLARIVQFCPTPLRKEKYLIAPPSLSLYGLGESAVSIGGYTPLYPHGLHGRERLLSEVHWFRCVLQ